MNIRNSFSLLLALLFVTLVVTVQPSSAVVPQKGSQAFGEGQFRFNGERINFSFDAKANENGKTHGQAQFTFTRPLSQTEITIRIQCLSGGSTSASMSGVIQHSDDPRFPKHARVFFAVIDSDNIPAPNSLPDQITPLFGLPPDFIIGDFNCTPFLPLTLLDLDSGDIELEP